MKGFRIVDECRVQQRETVDTNAAPGYLERPLCVAPSVHQYGAKKSVTLRWRENTLPNHLSQLSRGVSRS